MISIGDSIQSSTFRKVVKQNQTSVSSQKVRTVITVKVTKTDFDPVEGVIRVSGQNVAKNRSISLGSFHTSEIEVNRKFTLTKNCWDYITLQRLKKCCDIKQKARLAAVVMEKGLANVCLITNNLTLVRATIEKSFPKKRGNYSSSSHKEAKEKFFKQILSAILRHIDISVVKCIILASPGFLNQELRDYIIVEVSKFKSSGSLVTSSKDTDLNPNDQMKFLSNKISVFLLAHSSTGQLQSLEEVLASPKVLAKIDDVAALLEVNTLNKFFEILRTNADQAVYSLKYVLYCLEESTVETLLISDSLFRSNDLKDRRFYVDLVEKCQVQRQCKVVIFSSMHVTGKKLDAMTGIAAILRYSIPDLDDLVEPNQVEQENFQTEMTPEILDLTTEEKNLEVYF